MTAQTINILLADFSLIKPDFGLLFWITMLFCLIAIVLFILGVKRLFQAR